MKSVITDYEGKVVEWEGTDDEALKKGLNVNCSRCSGCSGCSDCSYCSGCSDCSRCSYCSDCSRFSYCSDCSGCSYCSGCSRCSYCSDCSGCSYCSYCSRCSYCSGCSRCSVCYRCSYCSDCSYCEKKPLSVLTTDRWIICIRQDRTIKIGCQDHTADEWMAFTDDEITAMHSDALVFWRKWKPVIAAILS